MPEPTDHQDQAEQNSDFADLIEQEYSSYKSWIITAKFYSALHYVDKALLEDDIKPENHGERFGEIDDCRNIPPRVESLYEALYDLSKQARYKCVEMQQGQVNSADKALNQIRSELGIS